MIQLHKIKIRLGQGGDMGSMFISRQGKISAGLLGILIGLSCWMNTVAAAGFAQPPVTEIIVKLVSPLDRLTVLPDQTLKQLAKIAGQELSLVRPMSGNAHLLKLPDGLGQKEIDELLARLRASGIIEYADPNIRLYPKLVPNDAQYNQQWHYSDPGVTTFFGANLEGAWDITTGNPSVVVAVLDSGLLPHADIDANILDNTGKVVPGYDFISNPLISNDGDGRDADPSDTGDAVAAGECGGTPAQPPTPVASSWHGTHVAGTVAASTNNALGVAGAGWDVSVQPVRALGKCGGELADILDAMRWSAGIPVGAVPNNSTPAKVINMSLGGASPCLASEQAAINDILARSVTIVVAAGNEASAASTSSPGNCNGVITVHATRKDGGFANYSNFGSEIDISAPGGEQPPLGDGILSTLDGGAGAPANDDSYAFYQGTSMATPLVSGIIGLMLSRNHTLSNADILNAITNTARAFPISAQQCNVAQCGAGIIDAAAAVTAVPPFVADAVPDAFAFTDKNNVGISQEITSDILTITGINSPSPVTIAGGEYSIGCTAVFTAVAGNINNNETICVRHTSSASFNTTTDTTLTIGTVSDTFSSTTGAPDAIPDNFGFATRNGVARSTVLVSDTITIRGLSVDAVVTVNAGEYSIGCTANFTAAQGVIANGQTVCVRHTTAAGFETATLTTLTIGGVDGTFTSTTEQQDSTPDAFVLPKVVNVDPNAVVISNTVIISGINTDAQVSVVDGEFSIGCVQTAFISTTSTIQNGQSICVRHTSSAASQGTVTTVLSIGGVSASFVSQTRQIEQAASGNSLEPQQPPLGGIGGLGGRDSTGGGCSTMGQGHIPDPTFWCLLMFSLGYLLRRKGGRVLP